MLHEGPVVLHSAIGPKHPIWCSPFGFQPLQTDSKSWYENCATRVYAAISTSPIPS
jgi:hypothetical protein